MTAPMTRTVGECMRPIGMRERHRGGKLPTCAWVHAGVRGRGMGVCWCERANGQRRGHHSQMVKSLAWQKHELWNDRWTSLCGSQSIETGASAPVGLIASTFITV